MSLKDSLLNMKSVLSEAFDHLLIEAIGFFRPGCRRKAGALSFSHIPQKCELGYRQDIAIYILDRKVHFIIFIFEDPKT